MRVGRNLTIGLANSIWSAVIAFAVVPVYLKYLGTESYGLIGFFTTTQALVSLLDLGLSSTINREIAKSTSEREHAAAAKLLHSLAVIYWGIALLILLSITVLSPLIATHWLQVKQLPTDTVLHAIILIGLVIACRWPIALYQGALMGSHKLALQSGINMLMATLSSLGAVLVLIIISPTIEAYFIWQAIIGALYVIVIRNVAWNVVGRPTDLSIDWSQLKSIWRFSLGLTGIGITSLVFTQLDKVILSKMLSLEAFGHYMLASMLVSGLYLLVIPVYNIIYPKLSALVAQKETNQLTHLYMCGTRALTSVLFPIAMILIVFSYSIVRVWTMNPQVAQNVAPIVGLLALGSALHGAMYFPYALQLANGMSKLALSINIALMCIFGPLIIFFTLRYGVLGSACAWLAVQVLYLFFGSWRTHQHLFKQLHLPWLTQGVLIPFCITAVVGLITYYGFHISSYNLALQLLIATCALFTALILNICSSSALRQMLQKRFALA